MKQGLLLTATLMLCLVLTSCGMRGETGITSGTGSETEPGTTQGNTAGSGTNNSSINQDEIGNADSYTNDNANTRARKTPEQRTAQDYLTDGHYEAGKDGKVEDRGSELGRDLTRGARDLIRDAKEMGKDLAKDAGDAANAAKNAGRDVKNGMKQGMT